MIGFELYVNGKKISAALEKGAVSIIATRLSDEIRDSIDLDFIGLNTAEADHDEIIDWYKTSLKIGDELTIKVNVVSENSTPIEVKKKNCESPIERKLKSYYILKEELEKQGLV